MWTTTRSFGLNDLIGTIERRLTLAHDRVTKLLWTIWRDKAKSTRSFRTGQYWREIIIDPKAFLTGGGIKSRFIRAGASHSEIVEKVLKPVPGYEAHGRVRAPALLAVEQAEPGIARIIDETGRDIEGSFGIRV
jgi:hypothetical protein